MAAERRRWRILVVEDATDIRDLLVLLLEAEAIEVVATGSGQEAAALVGAGDFDVLLTDLDLPDIPGDIVIRHVRATVEAYPRVIVLTGFCEPYLSQARDAGADVVLTKPVDWAVLWSHLAPPPPAVAA